MKTYLCRWQVGIFLLGPATLAYGQNISGYVVDENNAPVPFASVFVRELNTGASTDDRGKYFLSIDPGFYHVVVSSVGYQSQTFEITVADKAMVKNIRLVSSSTELNEIVVRASKRDPAFEIIQKVIDKKKDHLTQVRSARSTVYVRATEIVDRKKKEKQAAAAEGEDLDKKGPPVDPFEAARKKEEARLQQINLVEMQLTLNFQYPDRYKEERTAYKLYGSADGLYLPVFSEADFNFYHNLVDMKGISEIPVISPVSTTAIISYKYKLEEVLKENNDIVYKIRVTPRKTGDATVKGYLFINDSTWNINRLELSLEKGGLRFYDVFTIKQTYEEVDKNLWIPMRQEFSYETRGGPRLFKGTTLVTSSNYQRISLSRRTFSVMKCR